MKQKSDKAIRKEIREFLTGLLMSHNFTFDEAQGIISINTYMLALDGRDKKK